MGIVVVGRFYIEYARVFRGDSHGLFQLRKLVNLHRN